MTLFWWKTTHLLSALTVSRPVTSDLPGIIWTTPLKQKKPNDLSDSGCVVFIYSPFWPDRRHFMVSPPFSMALPVNCRSLRQIQSSSSADMNTAHMHLPGIKQKPFINTLEYFISTPWLLVSHLLWHKPNIITDDVRSVIQPHHWKCSHTWKCSGRLPCVWETESCQNREVKKKKLKKQLHFHTSDYEGGSHTE